MNWSYGGFTADPKGSFPRFSYLPIRQNGRVTMLEWTATLDVYLMGADSAAVESRVQAFMTECSRDGRDFIYSFPDGADSAHTVRSGDAIGGIRVVKAPSFENPAPGEHSIFRSGSVTFKALLPTASIPKGAIIQLDEDIQVDNREALPREEVVELLRAPFVRVKPRTYGVATAVQSGTIIAFGQYPADRDVPTKRWPSNYVPGPGGDTRRWPRPIRYDGIPVAFAVDYSYRFVFSGPIPGSTLPRYL